MDCWTRDGSTLPVTQSFHIVNDEWLEAEKKKTDRLLIDSSAPAVVLPLLTNRFTMTLTAFLNVLIGKPFQESLLAEN